MRAIDRLSLNLEGIVPQEPTEPVDEDEEVICVLPESLRPLWGFIDEIKSAHGALHVQLPRGMNAMAHDDPALVTEHKRLHAAQAYGERLFAELLEQELPPETIAEIEASGTVAIRAGWAIVRHTHRTLVLVAGPVGDLLGTLLRRH